jgi:hypothetical protein
MNEGPKWGKINEDEALWQAFENADQVTGEGLGSLLTEMQRSMRESGGEITGFEWHQGQGESQQETEVKGA